VGKPVRIWADFNGLFGDVLCLSHGDTASDERGDQVVLHEGMKVLAFDEDSDDAGKPDNLIATGTVARAPFWPEHAGSRWVLLIDADGVRHESNLEAR
jgi:hypothetical protein